MTNAVRIKLFKDKFVGLVNSVYFDLISPTVSKIEI